MTLYSPEQFNQIVEDCYAIISGSKELIEQSYKLIQAASRSNKTLREGQRSSDLPQAPFLGLTQLRR